MAKSPLPTDDVPTPSLDDFEARIGNWSIWTNVDDEIGTGVKVHVETVDLEVPPDKVTYGFEIRLEVLPERGSSEEVVRETVHNPYLALRIADELAGNADVYAGDWEEGLAPRPKDVGTIPEA